MDERAMTEPVLTDRRHGRSRARVVVTRWLAPAAVGAAAVVALGVIPAADAAPAADARSVPVRSGPVPGTDPAVQRWFKDRDGLQIELNDALVDARHLPRPVSAARPVCIRLLRAAGVLAALSRVPSPALEVPVRAGLDTFVRAATTCLAGNLPGAEQLVAQGLAARTAVTEQIDEILDGE
jgi:hypothetical protein